MKTLKLFLLFFTFIFEEKEWRLSLIYIYLSLHQPFAANLLYTLETLRTVSTVSFNPTFDLFSMALRTSFFEQSPNLTTLVRLVDQPIFIFCLYNLLFYAINHSQCNEQVVTMGS